MPFKMSFKSVALAGALLSSAVGVQSASAGAEPFLGEIMLTGYTFCPRGWADAAGQLLPISSNTALFSLYGTTYGGDGRTTFALPDLRGRVAVSLGQGPGLSNYPLGQRGGTETTTLSTAQLPPHTHPVTGQVMALSSTGSSPAPAGNYPAVNPATAAYGPLPGGGSTVAMGANSVTGTAGPSGSGQPVGIVQPYVTLRYCVALQGIFPSRN